MTRSASPGRRAAPLRAASAEPDLSPGVVEQFHGPRNATIQIDLPIAKAAFLALGDAWPDRLAFDELAARAARRLAGTPPTVRSADEAHVHLANVLFESYGAGLVQLYSWKPTLALAPSDRPTLSPLARLQVERGESSAITTLLHDVVFVDDPLARATLALLDGTRDRSELGAALHTWLAQQEAAGSAPSDVSPGDITPAAIEAKLLELARLGLFVA